MNLHGEIMNIDSNAEGISDNQLRLAFKSGHRDARHAAADLAIKAEKHINELENALADLLASHQDFVQCERNHDIGRPNLEWSEDIEGRAISILYGDYDDNDSMTTL